MTKWILFLLLSVGCFAQRPLEIVLDSVKRDNSDPNFSIFHLSYHIMNKTDKPATFFLKTDHIVPVGASSMSHCPHYKLFQNGKSVDVSGIFGTISPKRTPEQDWKLQDSLRRISSDPEVWRARMSESISKSKTTLQPGETRHFRIELKWDKKRYQKQDESEYYLDADAKYELELSMHLLREEIENRMTPEVYQAALKEPNFIKGWYTSNRLPIDLSEK